MDTLLVIFSVTGFNVAIAVLLYLALVHEVGQIRKDVRRLAKRNRSDRRGPRLRAGRKAVKNPTRGPTTGSSVSGPHGSAPERPLAAVASSS